MMIGWGLVLICLLIVIIVTTTTFAIKPTSIATEDQQSQDCNTEECGKWLPWHEWTNCTRYCGGGTRNRTRDCEEEKICDGAREEQEYCNTQECQGSIICG